MKDDMVENYTDMVVAATANDVDPRTKQIVNSLVRHLHHFVVDVSLTLDELIRACAFMVRAGKISDETRDEFILLANILGVEVLVDMISPTGGSQTTVLGPMYLTNVPRLANGASIVHGKVDKCETAFIEGFVRDTAGRPIVGATLDVWQASENGLYDVQDKNQPPMNLRGLFETDEAGHYSFRCLRPTGYPIPDDGPGGELLRVLKRHPMRPAHVHFIVRAPGKHPIISQLYDADCVYIDNDSIFAVKETLVLRFEPSRGRYDTDLYVRYDWTMTDQ